MDNQNNLGLKKQLAFLNVPLYLEIKEGTADGITFLGVLDTREIETPHQYKHLRIGRTGARFAVVDLVGVHTAIGKYYTRGKIITVVDDHLIREAQRKRSGRMAVALSGGKTKLAGRKGNYETLTSFFVWGKGMHNSWVLNPVKATPMHTKNYPEFIDIISQAYKNNWNFTFPVQAPSDYIDCSEDEDFTFISNEKKPLPQGLQEISQAKQPTHIADKAPINPDNPKQTRIYEFPQYQTKPTQNLGTSTKSGISELVQNRAITDANIKAKKVIKIEQRYKMKEVSKLHKKLEDVNDKAKATYSEKRKEVSTIGVEDMLSDTKTELEFLVSRLKDSWYRTIGVTTGKKLTTKILELTHPNAVTHPLGNMIEMLIDTKGVGVLNSLLVDPKPQNIAEFEELEKSTKMEDRLTMLEIKIYESATTFYYKGLELLLGVTKGSISDILAHLSDSEKKAQSVITNNPYDIIYLNSFVNISDLDKIAMYYGVNLDKPEIQKTRNGAFLHSYLLDPNSRGVGDNTIINRDQLVKHIKVGFKINNQTYSLLQARGVILDPLDYELLQYYYKPDLKLTQFALPKQGWVRSGYNFIKPTAKSLDSAIQDYIDAGLGVRFEFKKKTYIMDFFNSEKEIYIYNKLRTICKKESIAMPEPEHLTLFIDNFEKKKGFTLEQKQRESLSNLDKGVVCLTGPAGSGKTTTVELLVEALETFGGYKPEEILFGAPTGKAAKRLKEVVKRKTSTVNSIFGISGDFDGVYSELDQPEVLDEVSVLILDESSMFNLNIMYEILQRIDPQLTTIYFIGDIEQLPPIGKGKPFATMLTYLPTIVLDVSKRASEGSLITKNAEDIIYNSDGVIKDLQSGHDFGIGHTKDIDQTITKALDTVRYHLTGQKTGYINPIDCFTEPLSPDDIQVISPVNKNAWGCDNMNILLQDIFNPRKRGSRYVQVKANKEKREFRIGDRVLHQKNQKNKIHFKHNKETDTFTPTDTAGVVNGDVGKITGIYRVEEFEVKSNGFMSADQVASNFTNKVNSVFVSVEYAGFSETAGEEFNFTILYEMNIAIQSGGCFEVSGKDSYAFKLAYCMTTHKLQGSEAKLVIVLLQEVGNDFISRNMIYTSITRAKGGCYLFGDILGQDSVVNKGRKIMQTDKRQSPIDLYPYAA